MESRFVLLAALALAGCGGSEAEPGYPAVSHDFGKDAGGTIHAIGIYDTGDESFWSDSGKPVEVFVHDQGKRKIKLALAAYRPVVWEITGPGAGSVEGVYMDGNNRHEVTGVPIAAAIINLSGTEDREIPSWGSGYGGGDWADPSFASGQATQIDCVYTYQVGEGGCQSGMELVMNAQVLMGGHPRSFTGAYSSNKFEIRSEPPPPLPRRASS